MKVEFLRWPADRDRRQRLGADGVPRLLLIENSQMPPITSDPLEDWIRLPAADDDVRARVAGLLEAHDREGRPVIDDNGLLRFRGRWTAIPPIEASLIGQLLDHFGSVVSREDLTGAGWPDAAPGRNALDVHMLRLRRRIDDLGLAIRTVRSRGYLLEIEIEGEGEGEGSGAVRSAFTRAHAI